MDSLSSNEFVVLARVVEKFACDCESVCEGRQSHHLRGTLLSQAKRFVEKFHEERRHQLRSVSFGAVFLFNGALCLSHPKIKVELNFYRSGSHELLILSLKDSNYLSKKASGYSKQ